MVKGLRNPNGCTAAHRVPSNLKEWCHTAVTVLVNQSTPSKVRTHQPVEHRTSRTQTLSMHQNKNTTPLTDFQSLEPKQTSITVHSCQLSPACISSQLLLVKLHHIFTITRISRKTSEVPDGNIHFPCAKNSLKTYWSYRLHRHILA